MCADLYGADLRCANLYGADLYGANLYGATMPEEYGKEVKASSLKTNHKIGAPKGKLP